VSAFFDDAERAPVFKLVLIAGCGFGLKIVRTYFPISSPNS